jgi:hypothetical protein
MKMTPKDIFGIVVRVAGLFMLRLALWLFYDYMAWYYHIPASAYAASTNVVDPKIYMIWGVAYLAIGVYLLSGAPHLLRFSYPDAEPPQSTVDRSDEPSEPDPERDLTADGKTTTCVHCHAAISADSDVCPECGRSLY